MNPSFAGLLAVIASIVITSCAPAKDDAGAGKTEGVLGAPSDSIGMAAPATAVVLLDESGDTSKWRHEKAPKEPLQWPTKDGVLTIVPGINGSIVTKENVEDFRLHLEFKVNAGTEKPDGNSGIYIQRRYELQILDAEAKSEPLNVCGAIYKFKAPDTLKAAKPAGQWQCYDIVFRAARWEDGKKIENARLSAHLNGKLIHDDVAIPDKTGAGREESAEAQPIKLQDHGNAVQFRNIWMIPLEL